MDTLPMQHRLRCVHQMNKHVWLCVSVSHNKKQIRKMKNSHQRITVNWAIFVRERTEQHSVVSQSGRSFLRLFCCICSFVRLFVVPLSTWSLCVNTMHTLGLLRFFVHLNRFRAHISSKNNHREQPALTLIHFHGNWQNDGKNKPERVSPYMWIFRILGLATNYTHTLAKL